MSFGSLMFFTSFSLRAARGLLLLCGWLAVFLTIGPSSAARAQTVRELSPEESVRLGLEHSARVRAARADVAAAQAAYLQTRAGRLPLLRTQATYTRLGGDLPEIDVALPGVDDSLAILAVERDRYHSEVSVEQTLFTGFRLRNEVRAAAHEATAAELAAEREQADVAFEVRRTYWDLYRALAVRDSVEKAIAQVEEHLADVRNRFELGAALTSDVLAAQTRRSEVLLERVEAENAVRVRQLELNRLTGLPLDTPVRPAASLEVQIEIEGEPGAGLEAMTAAALEKHPRIRALGEQVSALRSQLQATRGAWFPELSSIGRYIYSRPNPYSFVDQDQFRGTWELGLSLRWDLWEGGRRNARTSEARARLERAEAQFAAAREEVAVEVARQSLEVRRTADAVEVAEQNIQSAEETFRVFRQQFAEGVTLSTQVLDAEQDVHEARARRAQALADHAVARAALLNALGRVW